MYIYTHTYVHTHTYIYMHIYIHSYIKLSKYRHTEKYIYHKCRAWWIFRKETAPTLPKPPRGSLRSPQESPLSQLLTAQFCLFLCYFTVALCIFFNWVLFLGDPATLFRWVGGDPSSRPISVGKNWRAFEPFPVFVVSRMCLSVVTKCVLMTSEPPIVESWGLGGTCLYLDFIDPHK